MFKFTMYACMCGEKSFLGLTQVDFLPFVTTFDSAYFSFSKEMLQGLIKRVQSIRPEFESKFGEFKIVLVEGKIYND